MPDKSMDHNFITIDKTFLFSPAIADENRMWKEDESKKKFANDLVKGRKMLTLDATKCWLFDRTEEHI